MRKTIWAFLGVLVLAMTLLVACGEGGNDEEPLATRDGNLQQRSGLSVEDAETAQTDGASAEQFSGGNAAPSLPGAQPEPGNTGGDDAGGSEGGLAPLALQQVGEGRIIIYTSWMVVEVEDVSTATQQAQTAVAGLGGIVFGQETTTEPFARTVLTFKVLPEDFQEALRRLEDLGKLESQQISTDDVTERVVDLESRITTAEASVERLREFLSNATDLDGIAQIEAQLLVRETDLERLRGQLRTLQDQSALATIFVTLVEPTPDDPEAEVELVQTAYLGHDGGDRCPGDDELEVEENESVTICFAIENTGNLAFTEIEVRDTGLDLDEDDFKLLEGALAGPLEPGEVLIGYFEMDAELGRFASPRFSAVAVDEDGDTVRIGINVETEPVDLDVNEDTSVPSFVDGLTGSFSALVALGQVAILAVGVAIPFLWVPALVVALVILGRRLAARRMHRAPPPAASAPPVVVESDDDL